MPRSAGRRPLPGQCSSGAVSIRRVGWGGRPRPREPLRACRRRDARPPAPDAGVGAARARRAAGREGGRRGVQRPPPAPSPAAGPERFEPVVVRRRLGPGERAVRARTRLSRSRRPARAPRPRRARGGIGGDARGGGHARVDVPLVGRPPPSPLRHRRGARDGCPGVARRRRRARGSRSCRRARGRRRHTDRAGAQRGARVVELPRRPRRNRCDRCSTAAHCGRSQRSRAIPWRACARSPASSETRTRWGHRADPRAGGRGGAPASRVRPRRHDRRAPDARRGHRRRRGRGAREAIAALAPRESRSATSSGWRSSPPRTPSG